MTVREHTNKVRAAVRALVDGNELMRPSAVWMSVLLDWVRDGAHPDDWEYRLSREVLNDERLTILARRVVRLAGAR